MVGFLQIMIYLFCAYLVFKGVEIFQIAFVSSAEKKRMIAGIVIGVGAIGLAIVIAGAALFLEENMAAQMSKNVDNIPALKR